MHSLSKSIRRRKDAPSDLQPPLPQAHAAPSSSSSRAGMSSAFGSKARRVRFDLHLRIIDLNNVPLVSGTSFIKWHLPSSTAAEHRGRTSKCAIRDHRVAYDYEKRVAVRLTVGKDGMLQECSVEFEVLQEYGSGGRGERIKLGDVKLNLAEYVEAGGEGQPPVSPGGGGAGGDEGVVRRYLMQDSKINSTLKVGVTMKHIDGTRDYYAPPLRSAPVFGGIAGIIHSSESTTNSNRLGVSGENGAGEGAAEGQDPIPLPNLSSRNKEAGEMQDMYRRTLAAFWASQPGELRADECVEDIFAGGDGWGKHGPPKGTGEQKEQNKQDGGGGGGGGAGFGSRPGSGSTTPNPPDGGDNAASMHPTGRSILSMGGAGRHRHRHSHKHSKGKAQRKVPGELDEFDARDDMISWRIGERAYG